MSNEVLHNVKTGGKANWISHILCRKYLLNHITEGKTERIRRPIRCKQLLNDLMEDRRY